MCRPHVDQTCRTPQRWQILAPRLEQRQTILSKLRQRRKEVSMNEYFNNTPSNALFNPDKSWDAWSKLAKPVHCRGFNLLPRASLPERSSRTGRTMFPRASSSISSSIECMPAELLNMIFDDATLEKQDIIALGLCSQTLWRHMVECVERTYRTTAAPWAGTEIACIGSYLTDLPESFEKDGLAMTSVTGRLRLARMPDARRFNWCAWSEFVPPKENPRSAWCSALSLHHDAAKIPDAYWPGLKEDVLCRHLFPNTAATTSSNLSADRPRGWVLRNLTTKEFVRLCFPISENCREVDSVFVVVDDPSAPWLRLDDMLIMRICWTSVSTYRPDFERSSDLRRGKWAGHCFEVVMLEDTAGTRGSAEETDEDLRWKDITADIVSEAHELRSQMRHYYYD